MEEPGYQQPSTSKKRPRKESSKIEPNPHPKKKKKTIPIEPGINIPAKSKKRLEELLEKAEDEPGSDEDNPDQTSCAVVTQAWKLDTYTHTDYYAIVIDEIALEGLDGITLEALWLRISNTICQSLTDKLKEKAWEVIVNNGRLFFYELVQPRGKLVIFNRLLYIDDNSGHIQDPVVVPEDVYPFSPISEETANQFGIYGSCSTFDTRKDITDTARQMDLKHAESLGNRLVITADQQLRNSALGLADCPSLIKLVNNHYCVLERIGRARRIGESSAGKCSLQQVADSKSLFYLRKLLLSNDLITKQPLCLKNKTVGNTTALFFHLKRFYNQYKPKKVYLIERVMELLRKQPKFRMEYAELKNTIGVDTWNIYMKKIIKSAEFKNFFNTNVMVPYREMYPNATKHEWYNKNDDREKTLRILELVNCTANVASSLKEAGIKEDQKDDSSDEEQPLCESVINASVYNQTYDIVYNSGNKGLTHKQIQLTLGLDYYVVRGVLKYLTKKNFVYARNADIGRNHQFRYFAVAYSKHQATKAAEVHEEEDEEALEYLAEVLDVDKKYLEAPKKTLQEAPKKRLQEAPTKTLQEAPTKTLHEAPKETLQEAVEEKTAEHDFFNGEYPFITAYRKKCRLDKYNTHFEIPLHEVISVEDKKKYERILENQHEFYQMETSRSILKKLDVSLQVGDVFKCKSAGVDVKGFSLFDSNGVDRHASVSQEDYQKYQSEVEKSKRPTVLKRFLKPQKGVSKILGDYLFGTSSIESKSLIKKFNECLGLIKEQRANKYLEYPKILNVSEEHDMEDTNSLVMNLDGEFIEFVKNHEIKEFKDVLLEKFEDEEYHFHVEPKRKIPEDLGNKPKKAKIEKPAVVDPVVYVESVQVLSVDDFIKTYPEFKLESYFKDKITVNYVPPDKDLIETAIVHTVRDTTQYADLVDSSEKYSSTIQSARTINRTNFILDMVHKEKVISDTPVMMSKLKKWELQNKLLGQIDKKSFNRIVEKLVNEGYLKATKIFLRYKTLIRTKNIICLPEVDYISTLDKSVDEMKLAFFIYFKGKQGKIPDKEPSGISTALQEMDEPTSKPKYKQSRLIGRYYGHVPKCAKSKVLHEFLFYLIYGYNGTLIEKDEHPQFMKSVVNFGQVNLYKREPCWTMFIPKLTCIAEGWCLYSDVLLRMPIVIFAKIFNIIFVIPELMAILNDPIKKNLLVKHLPTKIRNACFYARKYIFSIYECLQNLAYLGLLQFGDSVAKKDEQPIYLNRNAIIYDTISSKPGYHQITDKEYPQLTFRFETSRDVENFWAKVWAICLKTRLGYRYAVIGQTITLHHIHSKPAMIEVCQPRTKTEAVQRDIGYIPGDLRGACGFDTNTWMGNTRNWVWHASFKTNPLTDNITKPNIGALRKKHLDKIKTVKLKDMSVSKKKYKQIQETRTKTSHSKRFIITRKIKRRQPTKKQKVPFYDDLDKAILKKLGSSRATFSEEEDDKLTIVDAALKYLFPMFKKRLISLLVIRDIMHTLCPHHPKQTSRAYNARILRKNKKVMLSHKEQYNYNLTEDKFVVKYFSKLKDRIQAGENIPQEHLHIALVYLIAYTIDYYEKNNEKTTLKLRRDVEYTDYLQDLTVFDELTSVGLYNEPTSAQNVVVDTVKSVIHSSFDCDTKSSSLYMLLAKIYQTYSDYALKTAISELRSNHMIKAKGSKGPMYKKPKTESIILPTHIYTFKFITKFPDCIYVEAFASAKGLGQTKGSTFNPDVYEQGHGIGLVELYSAVNINLELNIPDEVLVFNTSVTEYSRFLNELDARYKRFLVKDVDQPKRSEAMDDLEELGKYLKDTQTEKVASSKISALTYLLSKGLFAEGDEDDERLEKLSKHISVVYPTAVFSIEDKEILTRIIGGVDKMVSDIKNATMRDCVFAKNAITKELIEEELVEHGGNAFDLELATRFLVYIEDKDVLGATAQEIKDNFENLHGHLTMSTILQRLLDMGVIVKLGILKIRFLYYQCINDWTVSVEYRNEDSESGYTKARLKPVPWMNLDVSLNQKVFSDWMTTVLSHCISNPFAPVTCLFERFKFLKPVDLYLLLEYLQILGCIRLYSYENGNDTSSSLFSSVEEVEQRGVDILDEFDSIYLEMNHLAVLRFGAFLSSSHSDFTIPFKE